MHGRDPQIPAKMAGRLAHGHDIVDEDRRRGRIAFRFQLFNISKHAVDLGHGGIGARIDLGRTAGDDNFRGGIVSPGAPDGLSGLSFRLFGHRACVDHHHVFDAAL